MQERLIGLTLLTIAYTPFASAELFIDPTTQLDQGNYNFSGFFNSSTVEYEPDEGSGDTDVKRTLFGANAAYGITESFKAYGIFDFITESKFKDSGSSSSGESGTAIGVAVVADIPTDAEFSIKGYSQLMIWNEKYHDVNSIEITGQGNELLVGALAVKNLDNFEAFVGAELYLMKTIEGEQKGGFDAGTADIERSNIFGIRVGGRYDMDNISIFGNLGLVSETSFLLGASFGFQ